MKTYDHQSQFVAAPVRRAAIPVLFSAILAAAAALHLPAASAEFDAAPVLAGATDQDAILNVGTAGTDAAMPAFQLQHDPLTGEARLVAYDPLAAWLWAADNGFTRQMLLSETGTLTVYAPDGKTLTLDPAAGTITASDGSATVQIAGGAAGGATLPVVNFGNGARLSATGTGALAVTSSDALVATLNSGGIVVRGGTAAAPGLRFAGDSATGIFATAAGVLGFSTGGTERLRVDAAGNISLGALAEGATADERLVVLGNISLPTPGTGIKFADGSVLTSAAGAGLIVAGGGAAMAAPALPEPDVFTDAKLDGTTALANATVQTMTAKNIATFDGYTNFNSGVTFTNGINVAKGDAKFMGNYMMMGSYYYECENEGALAIIYEDDPNPDQIIFRTAPYVDWYWQDGNSTALKTQMKLSVEGNLTLYDTVGGAKTMLLDPAASTITMTSGGTSHTVVSWSTSGMKLAKLDSGSASAPSISFNSSANTGMFYAATNTLGFATNGNTALTIDGNGNASLSRTNFANYEALRLYNANTTTNTESRLTFITGNAGNTSNAAALISLQRNGTSNDGLLKFSTGNIGNLTERLRIDAAGSVVIRKPADTAAAGVPLQVFGGNSTGLNEALRVSGGAWLGGGAVNGSGPSIVFHRRWYDNAEWKLAEIGATYEQDGSNYDGDLLFLTNNGGGNTSMTERMRIKSDGKVGVGTASPDATLGVNGTLSVSGNASFGANATVTFNGTVKFAEAYGDISMGAFGE